MAMRNFLAAAALLGIAACATTGSADETAPAAGIRREPCGGGPVFPPEEKAAVANEQAEPRPE
jgi:nitrous oxide reductase